MAPFTSALAERLAPDLPERLRRDIRVDAPQPARRRIDAEAWATGA